MWNNQFPYFPPMMRSYGKNYDDNSCLYYEKERVYYDNRYPECFKDALKDLECKKINLSLVNGDSFSDVVLDEVEIDYIAIRTSECGLIYLIPINNIVTVGLPDTLAKDLWGQKVKKNNNKYYHK
ncbi:MAG: hypothetical protein MJA82_14310 [Clostridia bacterium]|nr:hypothetical protein [Clostridia bacterium]